jgi:hypothetical protein
MVARGTVSKHKEISTSVRGERKCRGKNKFSFAGLGTWEDVLWFESRVRSEL